MERDDAEAGRDADDRDARDSRDARDRKHGHLAEPDQDGEPGAWEPISPMTEEEAALFRFIRFGELPGRISPDDTIATVDTRSIRPPDPDIDDRGAREAGA
jgi:hypothetical protein